MGRGKQGRTRLTMLLVGVAAVVGATGLVEGPARPGTEASPAQRQAPEAPPGADSSEVTGQSAGPALIGRAPGDATGDALKVTRLEVTGTIVGLLARTTMVLTFRNHLDRALEGELVFPVPEGAAVSGFGLDVEGRLVDGVVVEQEQARIAFETEVRKGIDPGLLELVRGNVFRTRVWPIPARGHRTVRIEYVSNLTTQAWAAGVAALYRVPLAVPDAIPELSLRVEVVKGELRPEIRGAGLGNLRFEHWEERWVARKELRDVRPNEDLVVALPGIPEQAAVVERSDDGEYYFVIDDFPPKPRRPSPARAKPERVALLWDASLSRSQGDGSREAVFVESWLEQLGEVEVDVLVFRNLAEPLRSFSVRRGQARVLLDFVGRQPLDGATNLEAAFESARRQLRRDTGYAVLVSDGLATLGTAVPRPLEVPLFSVSASPQADHALLRHLAEAGGGSHFDLSRISADEALGVIAGGGFSFQGAGAEGVAELFPLSRHPVGGRFTFCGRLVTPEATVTLRYGAGGKVTQTRRYTLRQKEATATGLVPRLWAQQKVAELQLDAGSHRDTILALGRRFGIVTQGTSMLVLETLEQHLEHAIEPPATRPSLLAEYQRHVRQREERVKEDRGRKLDEVVAMWERRVSLWERELEYDPDQSRQAMEAAPQTRSAYADGVERLAEEATVTGQVLGDRADAVDEESRAQPLEQAESEALAFAPKKRARPGEQVAGGPAITVKPWDPDTPYLAALREASPKAAYSVYLEQRAAHGEAPAFYLDCADHLLRRGRREEGLRVLTAVLELEIEEPRLLRVVAHRLVQVGEPGLAIPLFERVLRLRSEEPQSLRDLALALAARAESNTGQNGRLESRSVDDLRRGARLLYDVVLGRWDGRFPEIEVVALMDMNRLLAILERGGGELDPGFIDPRLHRLLDVDLRVVLTWDTDLSDMDLWVLEPNGEKCFYSNTLTDIGGMISRDFTGGYGPEEYLLRRALAGSYRIQTNYYGSSEPSLVGPTTVQVTVFTDFGRPEEERRSITLRLTQPRDVVEVGEVEFEGSKINR